MNLKTLPTKGQYNKLIDRGRVRVFIGYTSTIAQLRVYALDLGYTIRSSIVEVNKLVPRGIVKL